MPAYGESPKSVTGGKAPKFFSSLRMNIHKAGYEKDEDKTVVGQRVRIEVEKNSFGSAFGEARPIIIYGSGIDHDRDILETAKKLGMIEQSASWLTFKDGDEEVRGHGEKELLDKIREKLPEIKARIRERILKKKKEEPQVEANVEAEHQQEE